MDMFCLSVQKCSDIPRISSETEGETWENSSTSACTSIALTPMAFELPRMINPRKAKKKIGDKACAITKREPERNCCALGPVSHGLSGGQLLAQPEKDLSPFLVGHNLEKSVFLWNTWWSWNGSGPYPQELITLGRRKNDLRSLLVFQERKEKDSSGLRRSKKEVKSLMQ